MSESKNHERAHLGAAIIGHFLERNFSLDSRDQIFRHLAYTEDKAEAGRRALKILEKETDEQTAVRKILEIDC